MTRKAQTATKSIRLLNVEANMRLVKTLTATVHTTLTYPAQADGVSKKSLDKDANSNQHVDFVSTTDDLFIWNWQCILQRCWQQLQQLLNRLGGNSEPYQKTHLVRDSAGVSSALSPNRKQLAISEGNWSPKISGKCFIKTLTAKQSTTFLPKGKSCCMSRRGAGFESPYVVKSVLNRSNANETPCGGVLLGWGTSSEILALPRCYNLKDTTSNLILFYIIKRL